MNKEKFQEKMARDIKLSSELAEVFKKRQGLTEATMGTWDDIYKELEEVCEKNGCFFGVPFNNDPAMLSRMVIANGAPLRIASMTWHGEELERQGFDVRNSWEMLGDRTISIVNTSDKGPMAYWEWHAGARIRKFMAGWDGRNSALTAEIELKALESLRKRITQSQFDCYVLNNAFPEKSKRSDLHYIFRKGLPTLVLSYHKYKGGRILCALCMHPLGYYSGTHVGMMTPTDEVIAHLLLMRADEHRLWRMCGQWAAHDPRAGL